MAMMKYFPIGGNEIKYEEKQKKITPFFPLEKKLRKSDFLPEI